MSFRERTELSLIPSLVRRLPKHVIRGTSESDISALKAAIIYGANASGKSNLIKAIKHAQNMVNLGVKSSSKIPYFPYMLDNLCTKKPTLFEFEIKIGLNNYAYGFSSDRTKIHEEWLYKINKKKDTLLFERKIVNGISEFNLSGLKFNNRKDKQFLEFTTKGIPANRLFLNECRERNVLETLSYIEGLVEVSNWFKHSLTVVFPSSKYHGLETDIQKSRKTNNLLSKILNSFDTGIEEISLQEIDFKRAIINIPEEIKQEIIDDIDENSTILISGPNNTRYQVCKSESGEIKAFKLMTKHIDSDGNTIFFDLNKESDGTQRLLDIAPGLLDIFSQEKTYIIDELDRSLHPDITTSIFKAFLEKTSTIHSQLIVTTHETNLLNQDLIRKDEIWFVQKDKNNASSLYSLEEFQPRFDRDIRRGYLSGRFAGVPQLSKFDNLSWMNLNGESQKRL